MGEGSAAKSGGVSILTFHHATENSAMCQLALS